MHLRSGTNTVELYTGYTNFFLQMKNTIFVYTKIVKKYFSFEKKMQLFNILFLLYLHGTLLLFHTKSK